MPAKLLYRDASGRDASVDIAAEGCFLGRAADCAVRTDDAMVSRKNCKISLSGGRWMVEDLGSSNGTFVNEQRIQKQALTHADVVRCGTLQVRFVEVAGAQPQAPVKPKTMSIDVGAAGVQVDPSLTGPLDPQNLMALKGQELQQAAEERDALAARLREASQELDSLRARQEADQAELKKLRGDLVQQRDRLGEITRQKSLQDDELHAQTKVAEELRLEVASLKDESLQTRSRNEELTEEMAARDRQLERAQDDVQRAKVATDELRAKLAELQKTKDEGWRELNNRVGEIDHLREVISEQERILEERRVGLIQLETSAKEIRADREKVMRDGAQVKAERDQLRDQANKMQAQVDALEEEHRRLARAMVSGPGDAGENNEEHLRLATELRELKVEQKKVESDRDHLAVQVRVLEASRAEMDDKHAKAEVERSQLAEQKATAEAARTKAEEAGARAETARQRAEEEKAAATRARDTALATSDELRQSVERERKHAADLEAEARRIGEQVKRLEAQLAEQPKSVTAPHQTVDADGQPMENSEARIRELEEELSKLATELALVQSQPAPEPHAAPEAHAANGAAAGGEVVAEIKRRAEEAYTGINDALSELRTNIVLAKDLVAEHGAQVSDAEAARTLAEAIQISMDRTEDAKGLLRGLREVIES